MAISEELARTATIEGVDKVFNSSEFAFWKVLVRLDNCMYYLSVELPESAAKSELKVATLNALQDEDKKTNNTLANRTVINMGEGESLS